MYDDLYCKIFIDTNMEYDELFLNVMNYVNGKKKSFSYVVGKWCDMFINKNKEYNEEKHMQDVDNFLYWKYYLDIEPDDIEDAGYIEKISDLIKYLRGYCNDVIVACDFEDKIIK